MTIRIEDIKQLIKLLEVGCTPRYALGNMHRWLMQWPVETPNYVKQAAANWKDDGTRSTNNYLIFELENWVADLSSPTIKGKFAIKSVQQVIDSLASCNDELETALSCVHHHKDDEQIKQQIDRLTRNFVVLVNRTALETLPKSKEIKVGVKVHVEGTVVGLGTDRVAVDHDGTRILWCYHDVIPVKK